PPDMLAFLQAGDPAMDAARAALAHVREHVGAQRGAATASGLLFRTDEPGFRLEAPVPRPGKVLAVGVNYKDHAEEAKIPLPERPIIFTKLPSGVIGTGAPIHRPRVSTKLDFEGELCVVIGKHARHVAAAAADADTCVAGYMIGNDVSVRDWQFHSPTWVMGKSFDTHGPTGPWLVTRDEIPDPASLRLQTWENRVWDERGGKLGGSQRHSLGRLGHRDVVGGDRGDQDPEWSGKAPNRGRAARRRSFGEGTGRSHSGEPGPTRYEILGRSAGRG